MGGGEGGGPSLTDVLVVLYLLYRVFQWTIPRELKFRRKEGGFAVWVRVGMGAEGLIIIPEESYNTL